MLAPWEWFISYLRKLNGVTDPVLTCPAYTGPGSLCGIGVDYNWLKVDYAKAWPALARAGCNATGMEFFMWDGIYDLSRGLGPLKGPYERALDEARKHKGIIFNSVANDNQGRGKYGDKRKALSHYGGLLNDTIAWLGSLGPEGQWIQPVAEGTSSFALSFEKQAIAALNKLGFVTVWNKGSRPTEPGSGSDRNAYHPFKTSDVGTPDDIVVTDTGTIIATLTKGGIYGSAMNDATVGKYAKAVRKAGRRDLVVYTFTGMKELDVGAAQAIGEAWK